MYMNLFFYFIVLGRPIIQKRMDLLWGRDIVKMEQTVQKAEVNMYIIAGLGNPDRKYVNTRHNIGFEVIDAIAEKNDIVLGEKKHKAVIGKGMVAGQKVILVKPVTYMNLSGESIRSVIDFYKADEKSELIVISDDISLDVGQIRIRKRGSAGGHNGLKNIILHLGHDSFIRVRMGVGDKPPKLDLAAYVLGHFLPEEREGRASGTRPSPLKR